MKTVPAILSLCAIAVFAASAAASNAVALEEHVALCYSEITPTRQTPSLFVRQALESLGLPDSDSSVLFAREAGYLGNHPGVEYSLIAYQKSSSPDFVRIEGEALVQNSGRAFSYWVEVRRGEWPRWVVLVVETLSAMPSHEARQSTCEDAAA